MKTGTNVNFDMKDYSPTVPYSELEPGSIFLFRHQDCPNSWPARLYLKVRKGDGDSIYRIGAPILSLIKASGLCDGEEIEALKPEYIVQPVFADIKLT